jgi:hypothetical protein
MLKFSPANSKLIELQKKTGKKVYSFSTLAGVNCPYANECLSKVVIKNNKRTIEDGPNTKFRCFSASNEVLFPAVYNSRKYNMDLLRSTKNLKDLTNLINSSIPKDAKIIRIHVSGDFYSQTYFDAWVNVCKLNPNLDFYAYTKSLTFWVKRLGKIPSNLVLTASRGGKKDNLIDKYKLVEARVVYSESEAKQLGFKIDHTDELAYQKDKKRKSFALLIHGTQQSGSDASNAISIMRKNGTKFSYSK